MPGPDTRPAYDEYLRSSPPGCMSWNKTEQTEKWYILRIEEDVPFFGYMDHFSDSWQYLSFA